MIFHEEFILKVPHAEAWQFFTDFPGPISVLPGLVYVKEQAPNHFVGQARIKIGPLTFTFEGELKIKLVEPATNRVVLEGGAHDRILGTHFEATAYTQTLPHGPNHSRVLLEVHVGMDGVMGKMGRFILNPRARSIVDHYRQLCETELERRRVERANFTPATTLPESVAEA